MTWLPPTVSRLIGTARLGESGTFSTMPSLTATTRPSPTASSGSLYPYQLAFDDESPFHALPSGPSLIQSVAYRCAMRLEPPIGIIVLRCPEVLPGPLIAAQGPP